MITLPVEEISSDMDECCVEDVPLNSEESSETIDNNGYENVLNCYDGIVDGAETPSGYTETWYNKDMFGCLDLIGLPHDGYDIREDGVKTYNGYVMVATPNEDVIPKMSYIQTTLGMGYVVDVCTSGHLDIAVDWYI